MRGGRIICLDFLHDSSSNIFCDEARVKFDRK